VIRVISSTIRFIFPSQYSLITVKGHTPYRTFAHHRKKGWFTRKCKPNGVELLGQTERRQP